MSEPVVILGAGPSGLGAAYQLAGRGLGKVLVLEAEPQVGGIAGSFLLEGIPADYGSHRLHPSCDPRILADLGRLLGEDLLDRPRHGRIRFQGRWIHFPLKPLDLLMRLPFPFALSVAGHSARKPFLPAPSGEANFASVLEAALGKAMCREFYFPYARKLWGLPPEQLSAVQARRRVSGNSLGKLLRKLAGAVPGLRARSAGHFFYPRRGFGQICECLHEAARAAGAEFRLGCRVTAIEAPDQRVAGVRYEQEGQEHFVESGMVWSTLPLTSLILGIRPEPPPEVRHAATSLCFRAMVLIYLVLKTDQFTEFDAHYFPEEGIPISRLSEPKNYPGAREPRGRTVLCAELPCDPGSGYWRMEDAELGELVCQALGRAGLPVRVAVTRVVTRRLSHAYPIYRLGFEKHFRILDEWVSQVEGLLTFGRQGLFAHDNTHHALFMAYSAADCLGPGGRFDRRRWQQYRQRFQGHVVED